MGEHKKTGEGKYGCKEVRVLSSVFRHAKHDHKCFYCNEIPINAGTEYLDLTVQTPEMNLAHYRACRRCSFVLKRRFDRTPDGGCVFAGRGELAWRKVGAADKKAWLEMVKQEFEDELWIIQRQAALDKAAEKKMEKSI